MAFAGVATASSLPSGGAVVRWHALLEHGSGARGAESWALAAQGVPQETQDTGVFERKDDRGEGVWGEKAEDGSLEEEWVKVGSGGVCVAAIKEGGGIYVRVNSGGKWGYADAGRGIWAAGGEDGVEVGIGVRGGTKLKEIVEGEDVKEWRVVEGEGGLEELWGLH